MLVLLSHTDFSMELWFLEWKYCSGIWKHDTGFFLIIVTCAAVVWSHVAAALQTLCCSFSGSEDSATRGTQQDPSFPLHLAIQTIVLPLEFQGIIPSPKRNRLLEERKSEGRYLTPVKSLHMHGLRAAIYRIW